MSDRDSNQKSVNKKTSVKKGPRRPSSDKGRSRLGDHTRPIALDRQLTTNRRWTIVLSVVAFVIAVAFAVSLFVTPIRNYLAQEDRLATRAEHLEQLRAVNAVSRADVERLQTPDGIREAAREELGYQNSGEKRETIIDEGLVPTALPAGWPYDLVTNIVATQLSTGATSTTTP